MNRYRASRIFIFVISLCGLAGVCVLKAYCLDKGINCAIQQGPCMQDVGEGLRVLFEVDPRPVKAMNDLKFIITLTRSDIPVTDAAVVLDLSMPGMYMGRNRPALTHVKDGRYEGKGVITRCMSGNKTWKADISVKRQMATDNASFVFEVQ